MRPDYEDLEKLEGFESLSENAKQFLKVATEEGEIFFCDVCGRYMEETVLMCMSDHIQYCSDECADADGCPHELFEDDVDEERFPEEVWGHHDNFIPTLNIAWEFDEWDGWPEAEEWLMTKTLKN